MATETDAARDRVLAARASLGDELERLEASARAAVDVPAKIRRNPVRTAAVVGGAGFLVAGGPRRIFRAARRKVTGEPEPLPKSMLPEEVDKSLRKLGDDGAKVRGVLERDFAAYAAAAQQERAKLRTLLILTVARPFLAGATKRAVGWVFRTDNEGFQARLAEIQERVARQRGEPVEPDAAGVGEPSTDPPAKLG